MDYGFGGFFELRDAHDLLEKLRHDCRRLAANHSDVYAAFDFFVTANHMIDWVWPSDSQAQRNLRRAEAIPRICEHLADGAKHFILNRPHSGVADLQREKGAFQSDAFQNDAFDVDSLQVTLDPDEVAVIGKSTATANELAKIVLNYWEQRLGATLTS